jgi:hypothetical protein
MEFLWRKLSEKYSAEMETGKNGHQVSLLPEALSAEGAAERFFTGVGAHVDVDRVAVLGSILWNRFGRNYKLKFVIIALLGFKIP